MSSIEQVKGTVVSFLREFDPVEFNPETSGDRAERLADGLTAALAEENMLNLTDEADVEEPAEAEAELEAE